MGDKPTSEFEKAAGQHESSLIGEYVAFLRHNKKWWLLPILVALMMFGALIMISGTGAAPFIYTLF